MTKFTKEQLIEDLKSSTQNASGMFEISEDTICAVMYMLTTTPSPASVPGEIQKLKDGRGFKYVRDGVLYSVNYANGWNQCRSAMLQSFGNSEQLDEVGSWNNHRNTPTAQAGNHTEQHLDMVDHSGDANKMVAANSPVTPDGWISCSDRMPEDTKMLLAFSQGQIVAAYWNWVMSPIDYKKYRAFTYLSGNILDDVTHWMPLPEPPEQDGE